MISFMKRCEALQVTDESVFPSNSVIPESFKQRQLIDLIWNLNLPKEAAEILES